jgi:hypothetical protein
MASKFDFLLNPDKLYSRAEIFSKPCPVPSKAGVYAWYFKEIPPLVPTEGCNTCQGLTLLYIGISPRGPSKSGKQSQQQLRSRIKTHFSRNAYGSTLRLTLGCLLKEKLGIRLHSTENSGRLTFGDGEQMLSLWMTDNAYVRG